MMAGPSFGSAVAVSQGAGELELGMSDFLGFGWVGFLGRGTAAPGRCITGGRRAAGGGRRAAVGDAPRRPYDTIWLGGIFWGAASLRPNVASLRPTVASLRPTK